MSGLLVMLGLAASGMSWGVCRVDEGEDASVMVRHLKGACDDENRNALAVAAEDVVAALRQGRGVDLKDVVLEGDLLLDRLPSRPLTPAMLQAPAVVKRMNDERVAAVRVMRGPFILEDVDVRGILATNLAGAPEYVVVRGPVSMRGAAIRRAMDWSRTVFLERADFSGMRIAGEGFFLRAVFAGDADFTRTQFGAHTRFHLAGFMRDAVFTGAAFRGLAEFLEVSFAGDAVFARTRFARGAGFSGSRFHRALNFSEARFEREVYFRFTGVQGEANFRRTLFRNTADFTQAAFSGGADFQQAVFERPSRVSGVALPGRGAGGMRNPGYLLMALALALALLGLALWWKKRSG